MKSGVGSSHKQFDEGIKMHIHERHEQLLNTLFQCLNAHKSNDMADCYHEEASFEDIAFRLKGKKQIHAMWDMICSDNEKGKATSRWKLKNCRSMTQAVMPSL
jgi:hypothetical protein